MKTLLIYLSTLSAGSVLIANLAATKLWTFFGIPIDAGILIFPLSYVLGDLLMEFYGRAVSRQVAYASFLVNLLALGVFLAAALLPSHPDWHHQAAYHTIFTSAPRIIIASLIAFLASQLFNNLLFEKIRQRTGEKHFFLRSLGSSALARAIDILIFDFLAFFGILPASEFIQQIIFAYFFGMILELIFAPLTLAIVKFIKKRHNLSTQ